MNAPPDSDSRLVSKTDIMRYRACPYAFWVRDRGEVTEPDYLDAPAVARIRAGIDFEAEITAEATPDARPLEAIIADPDVPRLHLEPFGPPLRNRRLGLIGLPDAIDPDAGAMIPVEVKHHRRPRADDRLELAFYWLLTADLRRRAPARPIGRLVLPDGAGGTVEHEQTLQPRHFAAVRDLMERVRYARRYGVALRHCTCEICAGPMRQRVDTLNGSGDLTLIPGLGRAYAEALEAGGVANIGALADLSPEGICATVAALMRHPGQTEAARWLLRARSHLEERILCAPDAPALPDGGLLVDFEYDSAADSRIWLIGARTRSATDRQELTVWAERPDDELRALQELEAFLEAYPEGPLITWSGVSAEMVALRAACARWGMSELLERFGARHFDLYAWTRSHAALPIPNLALGNVGKHLGLEPATDITGGLDAMFRYQMMLSMDAGTERDRERATLEEYNRDDLRALDVMLAALAAAR